MPIRCVLFDFDGVIADTEERNADYLASALAHFGVRLTEEDRSALVGINDPSLLEATKTAPTCIRSLGCGSFSLRFAHRAFSPA